MTADHHEGPAARRRDRLATARLYVCMDLSRGLEGLLEFADSAFRGGVDILQVRDKHAEARAELEALRALRQIADRHGALLAANDRADVAALAGVDVLHLGQGDLSTADARTVVGPDVLIGRSTRTVEQLHEADQDPGIDYFCTGPIWSTPTKPGRAAVGLELARAAAQRGEGPGSAGRPGGADPADGDGSADGADGAGPADRAVRIGRADQGERQGGADPADGAGAPGGVDRAGRKPFFAIGGIDLVRVPEVVAAGADRIVVVRAVTEATDPEQAARELRAAVTIPSSG